MPSCEKCWRDARGEPDRYHKLIEERQGTPCTPEQQAGGEDAGKCEKCDRKTVHCVVGRCVNPECGAEAERVVMRDAVRYRWLREKYANGDETYLAELITSEKELDDYIDKMMAIESA